MTLNQDTPVGFRKRHGIGSRRTSVSETARQGSTGLLAVRADLVTTHHLMEDVLGPASISFWLRSCGTGHNPPSYERTVVTPWVYACDGPTSQDVATGADLTDLLARLEVRDGPFEERLTGFRSRRG